MSLLDMIPERDRAELRRNLFASREFFEAVRVATFSVGFLNEGEEPWFKRNFDHCIDNAFERHGFTPSNPEHAAALAASLAEIERVVAELEQPSKTRGDNRFPAPFRFGPEVRALAGPLRSAVERLRGLK